VTISGSYSLPLDPPKAYSLLLDPEVLARCMPGCKHLARVGENEYEMKMNLVISSISGLFDGKVRVADMAAPSCFRLIVEGAGKIGFLKGDGLLQLEPSPDSTQVRYEGDVQVGGVIAGVGQRLLDTTARMLIRRFFEKLSHEAAGADRGGCGA
jgi:carbon monoxide dehydrogenase subunit G